MRIGLDLADLATRVMVNIAVVGILSAIPALIIAVLSARRERLFRVLAAVVLAVVVLASVLSAIASPFETDRGWWDGWVLTPLAWIFTAGCALYAWRVGGRHAKGGAR